MPQVVKAVGQVVEVGEGERRASGEIAILSAPRPPIFVAGETKPTPNLELHPAVDDRHRDAPHLVYDGSQANAHAWPIRVPVREHFSVRGCDPLNLRVAAGADGELVAENVTRRH